MPPFADGQLTMDNAGETRSDARMETSEGPRATGKSRPEIFPTGKTLKPGGLSYRRHRDMKHPQSVVTLFLQTPARVLPALRSVLR